MINKYRNFDVILIVDGELNQAELMKESLQKEGRLINDIVCVEDGREAFDYMKRSGKYNRNNTPRQGLLLIDIKLPYKDSFEILQELKSEKRFKQFRMLC